MKIYDCIPVFNEIDILEIRLELMYNYVDYFVISECDYTFSGLKKPFYFEENKEKFAKYMDKIIHVKNENTFSIYPVNNFSGKKQIIYDGIIKRLEVLRNSPQTGYGQPHWCRDFLHKELVMLGLDACEPDDIILFSDLDEIPNPINLKFDGNTYTMSQKNMIYYVNTENITESWYGTVISKYSNLIQGSCMLSRDKRFEFDKIENGGWHLTWMGGSDRVLLKIESYGHQEFNNEHIKTGINNKLGKNIDILNRNIQIVNVDMKNYYPENFISLINNKFNYLICN